MEGRIRQWIYGIAHRCLDFLYPRYCIFCLQNIQTTDSLHVCESCCHELLPRDLTRSCHRCGFSKENNFQTGVSSLMRGTRCSYCWKKNFLFSNTRCLWNLQGLPREWIHKLKYHDGEYLVADLVKILAGNSEWRKYLSSAILVPVPLHWRRYWQRDYNQSSLIAHAMAKVSGSSVIPLLSRCKFSPSQTELRGHERFHNVQNAFSLNRKAKNIDRHHRIILVDDVMTTGATLQACAKVLYENGFKHIDVATLAHG